MPTNQSSVGTAANTFSGTASNVFSTIRNITTPCLKVPKDLEVNTRLKMDGLEFLGKIPESTIPIAFFDPRYIGISDKVNYSNEEKDRSGKRCKLPQMDENDIKKFIRGIDRCLFPTGHLFLWIDKFHLCQGYKGWLDGTALDTVDLVVWDKQKKEMGDGTGRTSKFLVVLQKAPRKAKGVWKIHNILDVWNEEAAVDGPHTHNKPVKLQSKLIEAVSNEGDTIIDPAAGSFSVMKSANRVGRRFLGCGTNTIMSANQPSIGTAINTFGRDAFNAFFTIRDTPTPNLKVPKGLEVNTRLKMDGLKFLEKIPESTIPIAFFDPQYRGILDKMSYGNEGKDRGRKRCELRQMSEHDIKKFIRGIDKCLFPTGHLFLWIDKFHLCQGYKDWLDGTELDAVDLIVWNKQKMGMGYRTRRTSEFLVILQKTPRKAKGIGNIHDIPDVWSESVVDKSHTHSKPVELQSKLIEATSNEGDTVIDPAAGSFSVMEAANKVGRCVLGCDING